MRRSWRLAMLVACAIGIACRGERRGPLTEERLTLLVDSLRGPVEAAAGLRFAGPIRSRLTNTEAVQAYLLDRVARDFPPERLEGVQAAYRLLGLLPDSLDLERLLLELYGEQVAGYYDPERETLYAIDTADPSQLRLIMAHEMVHALQHDHLPLDTLMALSGNGDVIAATQAVLEGHATVASIRVLSPGVDVLATPGFWETYREQVRHQQNRMAVLAGAPLVLREALIFPYLEGSEFIRWWTEHHHTPLPSRGELPTSSEQILHPDRYEAGDAPMSIGFVDADSSALHEDTLGELEIQILLANLRGAREVAYDAPLGWAGDRYRVFRTDDGPALVWYSVWDGAAQADRALGALTAGFAERPVGYQVTVEGMELDGLPGVRLVLAPETWGDWDALPAVRLMGR